MSTSLTNASDRDTITSVVQQYVVGARSGRGAAMQPAFHDDATIFGDIGTDRFAGPI